MRSATRSPGCTPSSRSAPAERTISSASVRRSRRASARGSPPDRPVPLPSSCRRGRVTRFRCAIERAFYTKSRGLACYKPTMRIIGGRVGGRTLKAPKGVRHPSDVRQGAPGDLQHPRRARATIRRPGCSISTPAPARSGSRRCRAAPAARCSSRPTVTPATWCAPTPTALGLARRAVDVKCSRWCAGSSRRPAARSAGSSSIRRTSRIRPASWTRRSSSSPTSALLDADGVLVAEHEWRSAARRALRTAGAFRPTTLRSDRRVVLPSRGGPCRLTSASPSTRARSIRSPTATSTSCSARSPCSTG